MTQNGKDTPGIVLPPPLVFLAALAGGFLLDRAVPVNLEPAAAPVRVAGLVLVVLGGRRQLTQRPLCSRVVKARKAVYEEIREVAGEHAAVAWRDNRASMPCQRVRDDGVFRRPPAVDSLAANPCSFGNRADGESADASCAQEVKGDVEDRVSGGLVAVTARVRPTRTRPGLISGAVSSRPMCGAPCRSSCAHIRDPSI